LDIDGSQQRLHVTKATLEQTKARGVLGNQRLASGYGIGVAVNGKDRTACGIKDGAGVASRPESPIHNYVVISCLNGG
jgi:hypothetical protein